MILVVASHPDDEVLGCGGTIKRLSAIQPICLLLLGKGRNGDLDSCIEKSADILGIRHIHTLDFPDQEYDSISLLEINRLIETEIEKWKPEIVFTHHRNDLNKDHRITYQSVLTACRPPTTVKKFYCFETLSSTEWQYPFYFSPNVWVNIGESIRAKTAAMQQYDSEIREGNHPRSIAGIINLARYRGQQVGVEYAEAFELVRELC
jgi:LmbE family N-acetylglucosaminyl deacetylase